MFRLIARFPKRHGDVMISDRFSRFARHPRSDVQQLLSHDVTAELTQRFPVVVCPATLVNLSRNGLQIFLCEPLMRDERLIVRIHDAKGGPRVALNCTARWRRTGECGCWSIGCEFDTPLSQEVLGQLFLGNPLGVETPV